MPPSSSGLLCLQVNFPLNFSTIYSTLLTNSIEPFFKPTQLCLTMIKKLRTQHRSVIQMHFNGFSGNEIAARLEMSPSTVSGIINSPLGQAYLGGLNDRAKEATLDVRKKLVSLNASALTAIQNILDPKQKAPHSVQLNAAKDVLDRNGYKPPDKINIDMTLTAKTDAEIDAEIAAMEQSINKTLTQDPTKVSAQQIAANPAKVLGFNQPKTATSFPASQVSPVIASHIIEESAKVEETDSDYYSDDELDLGEWTICDTEFEPEAIDETEPIDESLLQSIPKDIFNSAN